MRTNLILLACCAACSSGPPDDPAAYAEWLLGEIEEVSQDHLVRWGKKALARDYDFRDPGLEPLYADLRKVLQPHIARKLSINWESVRTKAALWELNARMAPSAVPFQGRQYYAQSTWTSKEDPPQRARLRVVFELRDSEAAYAVALRRTQRGGWEIYEEPVRLADGSWLYAIAHRIGFRQSDTVRVALPDVVEQL